MILHAYIHRRLVQAAEDARAIRLASPSGHLTKEYFDSIKQIDEVVKDARLICPNLYQKEST